MTTSSSSIGSEIMPSAQNPPASKKMLWASWIMSALPVLLLLFSGVMKLLRPPEVVDGMAKMGLSESYVIGLGVIEISCTILYLIPRTAVLGAILLTGYLGGATMATLRAGQEFFPVVVGVFLWGGLFLRDPRIRDLIPLRSQLRK
jgi:hypothetical protein